MSPDLALAPEPEARAALAGRKLVERIVLPPYPALGVGRLRVLRIDEERTRTVLVCGYDRYERFPAQ
jgi:hypothetical protein